MSGSFSVSDIGDDYIEVTGGSVKLFGAGVHYKIENPPAPPPPNATNSDPTLAPLGTNFVATKTVALKAASGAATVTYVAK
jgi:hypothetical protein